MSPPEKVETDFYLIDTYEPAPAFTVDGIPPMPGESWQEYHARALAWITIEASTVPANHRYLSRTQFLVRLVTIPLALFLAFR
jgi:hypothetical protein